MPRSGVSKNIGKGRRVLSEEEIYTLNKFHWVDGLSEGEIMGEMSCGATVIMRYMVHTWSEWLYLKERWEAKCKSAALEPL